MIKPEELKSEEIDKAADVLHKGGVIIFPTDTVYGIGCRWDDRQAIDHIKNIKKSDQEFPILISTVEQLYDMASVTPQVQELVQQYWPGPLTVIVKKKNEDGKIGIRMPKSELVQAIIKKAGFPIVGTSANFHGRPSVSKFEELDPNLIKRANYTLKGECPGKVASTVIDTTVFPFKLVREGIVRPI